MSQAVRSKPTILLPGFLVMGLVVGLGVWAVVASANSEMTYRHESALKVGFGRGTTVVTDGRWHHGHPVLPCGHAQLANFYVCRHPGPCICVVHGYAPPTAPLRMMPIRCAFW